MMGFLNEGAAAMPPGEAFWILYDRLRPALFSGFLSASAFLFAMKTFTIGTMKKDVYDSDHYLKMIAELRTVKSSLEYYGPLCRLRRLMFWAILCCLITSLLQFTVGLVHHWMAGAICLSAAAISIFFVFCSVIVVNQNLAAWLSAEEEKKNGTETKRQGLSSV